MADSMFQITGLASGISWDAIIEKTINQAKKPATQWKNQIDKLEIKKTLYQEISSEFFKLRNSLTQLKLESTYKAKIAEYTMRTPGVEASNVLKATVKTDATIAAWDINVAQLAKSQQHISNRQSDVGVALGIVGSFRIHVGQQVTTVKIEKTDSIRTINLQIQKAEDQNGNSMKVTAKLIDNRLVLESLESGLNSENSKKGETLTMSDADEMYLPRTSVSDYPPQVFTVKSGNTTYTYNKDYSYNSATGVITWLNNATSTRPSVDSEVTLTYSEDLFVTRDASNVDNIPQLPSGQPYLAGTKFEVYDTSGKKYTMGAANDFTVNLSSPNDPKLLWNAGKEPGLDPDGNLPKYVLRIGAEPAYSTDYNKFYLETDEAVIDENSVLAKLGFIAYDSGLAVWGYNEENSREAQNANLKLNGISVTRTNNTIDDLIANVTLELTGVGDLTMNITQDASKAVEHMEIFVEAYNNTLSLINARLEEKSNANNTNDEEDILSSIVGQSKGNTIFGMLHGDQILWNIKNQLRTKLSEPIKSLSNSLTTRKFLHPASSLDIQGSFYINNRGMVAKINITRTDSLEDVQKKLQETTSITPSADGTISKTELNLEVNIRNGQLVISAPSDVTGAGTKTDTIIRNSSKEYDLLSYVPQSSVPVNGILTVRSGNTQYTENVDFKVESAETQDGVMQSKIVWLNGGKSPSATGTYNVSYEYNQAAISFTPSSNQGDLSGLDLHYDSSNTQLSSLGITTEKESFGKSGLLEFDSKVFFEGLKSDPQVVSNVMTSFIRDMDTFIGNIVDSSGIFVGGEIVTKGRIAGTLKKIDGEIETLAKQIVKLEKNLEEKQKSMYKQYSDMEVAIQKLNSQLSSMTQYFNNTASKK